MCTCHVQLLAEPLKRWQIRVFLLLFNRAADCAACGWRMHGKLTYELTHLGSATPFGKLQLICVDEFAGM